MTLLIKNATVVDCNGSQKADIYAENGIITKVSTNTLAKIPSDCEVIDATGLVAMPAFIDLHCHMRTPGLTHKEDLNTATRAAVHGGFGTLVAMANTKPVCSSLEIASGVVNDAKKLNRCDVYQCFSMTRDFAGADITHLDDLARDTDAAIVKTVSEDGYGVSSAKVFYDAMVKSGKYARPVLIHAEERSFSDSDMAAAEDLETLRDLYLVGKAKADNKSVHAHFCHVSTEVSAKAIIDAKKLGLPVSLEVTPHHIALNDETKFRVNPPLRRESDRRYLIEAIKNGMVDAIATDHAPHTTEDKQNGAPGLVGLETAFAACYTALCKAENLPLESLSRLMSAFPAKLLRLNKGEIKAGFIADIVLIDLDKKLIVDSQKFYSKGKNTPFDGMALYGEVVSTILKGVLQKL